MQWNMDSTRACELLTLIGVAGLMLPTLHYVVVGWKAKRKDIMDGLDAKARLAYFIKFSRSDPTPSSEDDAAKQFEKLYTRWYGRRFFALPGVLLLLVALAAVTLVTLTGLHRLHYLRLNPLADLPDMAMAALAGAYLWVVNDLVSRARRLDFAPANVMWGVLRLVTAIPMGYAFAAIASKSLGPFVAFALGAFPLATLTSMLQHSANKALRLTATDEEAANDIIKLQGVNKAIVERLADEDITTVTQIAYCDPVRLIMRSNLTFNFVTDCMNQALAWMYLEKNLVILRPLGMRGAAEIRLLIRDFDGANVPKEAHDRAVAAMPLLAAAVNQDPATLQVTFRQIAEDPYTIFLEEVWT